MNYCILCGGSGTRLWPLSTEQRPKQFIPLPDGRTLLETTTDRNNNQFIETKSVTYVTSNVIEGYSCVTEPYANDTGVAIARYVDAVNFDDDEPVLVLPSDHYISNIDYYHSDIHQANKWLQQHPEDIILFGIPPTQPNTGYGYIIPNSLESRVYSNGGVYSNGATGGVYSNGGVYSDGATGGVCSDGATGGVCSNGATCHPAFPYQQYDRDNYQQDNRDNRDIQDNRDIRQYNSCNFYEKPDTSTAQRYIDQGAYWNSGIVLCTYKVLKQQCQVYRDWIDHPRPGKAPSFDVGVLMKYNKVHCYPSQDWGWSDIGTWESFLQSVEPSQDNCYMVDCQNVSVYNPDSCQVVVIGCHHLIICLYQGKLCVMERQNDHSNKLKLVASSISSTGSCK